MNARNHELTEIRSYIQRVDKEVTLILQTLQWDRKKLLEGKTMVTCKYDSNHKVLESKKEIHEKECYLKSQGYSKQDKFLPDPLDPDASTVIKFDKNDIKQIIEQASQNDSLFKKGMGCEEAEPLTFDRLQTVYTCDERRAIHTAVVNAVPSCHDLADLALPSGDEQKTDKPKSRLEILLELRNMKRRRTKYRVAAKTRNYSDVLRDVIKTQMELYTEVQTEASSIPKTSANESGIKREIDKTKHEDGTVTRKYESQNDGHRKRERSKSRNMYEGSGSKDRRNDVTDHRRTNSKEEREHNSQDRGRHHKEKGHINNKNVRSEHRYEESSRNKRSENVRNERDKRSYDERNDKHEKRKVNEYYRKEERYRRYYDAKRDDEDYSCETVKKFKRHS